MKSTTARGKRTRPGRAPRFRAFGAVAVAALLATTACQAAADGSKAAPGRPTTGSPADAGDATAAPGSTPSPTPPTPAKPDTTTDGSGGTGGGTGTGSGNSAAGGSGSGGKGGGGTGKDAPTACTPDDLAVSATTEPPHTKIPRHLLLTVQNAGDDTCLLYRYPRVQLGADAQATVPVIPDSDPDPGRPVTLAPGDEAHAALLVSGGHRDEYEARSITVALQGPRRGSTPSRPLDVPMPAEVLYADDGQLVTYWTTASGGALDFIMSR
ncbi:DUF4232 domain-containing protein [Streptomyces sp. NPDC058417]|uniref:DUF4232 domain-containing protein n=1 Tax=unclassified Streptomyces TaxID=2593676 RepID=UPI003653B6A9